jgi:hypothetical protein
MKQKKNRELTLVSVANLAPTFIVLDEYGYPTKHKPTKAEIAHWHRANTKELSNNTAIA